MFTRTVAQGASRRSVPGSRAQSATVFDPSRAMTISRTADAGLDRAGAVRAQPWTELGPRRARCHSPVCAPARLTSATTAAPPI